MLGLLGIPLTYYPLQAIIKLRKIEIPWTAQAKKAFRTMISFMLIAAISEEIFFRGLIISLTLHIGILYVVLISAGTHVLVHFFNPSFRMIEKTLDKTIAASGWISIGFLMAILFVYTGSLAPVILAHIISGIGFGWMMSR